MASIEKLEKQKQKHGNIKNIGIRKHEEKCLTLQGDLKATFTTF